MFFLEEMLCRTSSSASKSHRDDKYLSALPLKDTGDQGGLISIKGVRNVSQDLRLHSGLLLLSSVGLSLAAYSRILLPTVNLVELVVGVIWSNKGFPTLL